MARLSGVSCCSIDDAVTIAGRLVALDGFTMNPGDNPWTPVESLGDLTVHDRTAPDEVVERSLDAEVVLTNKVVMDEKILSKLPKLQLIAVTATGYNVVDIASAREQNISVVNVPEYSTQSVAQHVMAVMLSFIHQPALHHDAIQNGNWKESEDFSFWLSPLRELSGKTLGIVGLGRVGRATARLADAFGMKVVAASRRHIDPLKTPGFEWLSVDNLFGQSDFVSLHCPLTSENQAFVDRPLLSKMPSHAVLINTARGGLINEFDLADMLNEKRIAGAILDVVSDEPISESNPLLGARNCVLTPHIAWATIESRRRLMQMTADNIAAFMQGNPINIVN